MDSLILIVVMLSWYAHVPKFIKLYTLNMCTLFHVNDISIKWLFKKNQDCPLSRKKEGKDSNLGKANLWKPGGWLPLGCVWQGEGGLLLFG